MRSERAQALVEVVAALPVCMACALVIVDGGIVVRDRIAVAQAATVAAAAQAEGRDPEAAARQALPASLAKRAVVTIDGSTLELRAASRPALVGSVGIDVEQRSTVEVDA